MRFVLGFNKPWSFHHWLKQVKPTGKVLAILDPDEFFLEALSQKGRSPSELIHTLPRELASTVTDVAKPGMAVAQMYGIGDVVVHKVR